MFRKMLIALAATTVLALTPGLAFAGKGGHHGGMHRAHHGGIHKHGGAHRPGHFQRHRHGHWRGHWRHRHAHWRLGYRVRYIGTVDYGCWRPRPVCNPCWRPRPRPCVTPCA